LGFTKCLSEQAVCKRGARRTVVILGVYVDDLIVTGSEKKEIEAFKKQITEEFEMSDLGLLSFYLGIEVDQQKDYLTLKQSGYARKVLSRFGERIAIQPNYPWILAQSCMKTRRVRELMQQNIEGYWLSEIFDSY